MPGFIHLQKSIEAMIRGYYTESFLTLYSPNKLEQITENQQNKKFNRNNKILFQTVETNNIKKSFTSKVSLLI